MGSARSFRGAGNGRLSVATAAAFRASVRGQEIRGVLAGFQIPLPTDLILFRTFPFFPPFWRSWGGGGGAEQWGVFMRSVVGSTRAQATTRVAWSGDRFIPQSQGLASPSPRFLSGLMWGRAFRRERVVQRRWSPSLPARSWLRPGLAGPIAPTRAGNSAGGSPRTPELGLHRRTKASQTPRLDAKFENKANLEKLGVRVLAKPREGPQFWGSRPATWGRIFGVRVL